jgi:glycosyltransferase involved in cell wall biosynthesis
MNKNILYISYDGMTDPLGQSQVLPYITKLSAEGFDFHLISFEKEIPFEKNKENIQKICDAANITWHPIKYTKNPPVFSTIWDIYKMNKKAFDLHLKHDFSLVHCRSYISALVGLKMKRKKNVPFIFDMRGFWADERVDGNIWDLKHPFYKFIYNFFKKKEKQYLAESDRIISLTSAGKKVILDWNVAGVTDEKIEVIPCATDFDLFEVNNKFKKEAAKKRLNLSTDTFVLNYIGSIGTWYLLNEMLQFFSVLKESKSNAKFLILTGEQEHVIFDAAKSFNISKDDLIIQFVQRKDIPSYAHASDASIFFIKPSFSKISSSPTKMGELLAMGIPIICNSGVGDVQSFVEENNVGLFTEKFDLNSLKEVVNNIDKLLAKDPDAIRESSRPYFLLENGVSKYLQVYNQIV